MGQDIRSRKVNKENAERSNNKFASKEEDGARDLQITDVNNPNNWRWKTLPDGSEVAMLLNDSVLEIQGMTTNTVAGKNYEAYFVFNFETNHNNVGNAYAAIGDKSRPRLITLTSDDPQKWSEVALGAFPGSSTGRNIYIWGVDQYASKSGLVVKGIDVRLKP